MHIRAARGASAAHEVVTLPVSPPLQGLSTGDVIALWCQETVANQYQSTQINSVLLTALKFDKVS